MVADIEHREVYREARPAVTGDGLTIIGKQTVTISQSEGSRDFSICVHTEAGDMDEAAQTEVVRVTPAMLAAMQTP